ncbi:histidine phosphatase family protein [Canibacter zhuwentaonis]|uniref:histidine phosphatase family protein n=1 Tax=Canibacter zhuwentaonis TaxID=2837491 RepID=UPI0032B5CD19
MIKHNKNSRFVHLVRHGEVDNPEGVLYGRIPGFKLSERGHMMAQLAADHLADSGRKIGALYASPLLRAQQSAQPFAEKFGLEVNSAGALIEPKNKFEGMRTRGVRAALQDPAQWPKLWNPLLPSWGEPYARIARRATRFMDYALQEVEACQIPGDVVLVSHQAVIWVAHRKLNGLPLPHNPAKRRCELSSVTTFEKRYGRWREVAYVSPAQGLIVSGKDTGAV